MNSSITHKKSITPQVERNRQIYRDWLSGVSMLDLSIKHRITYNRIQRIIKRQQELLKK